MYAWKACEVLSQNFAFSSKFKRDLENKRKGNEKGGEERKRGQETEMRR